MKKKVRGFNYRELDSIIDIQEQMDKLNWGEVGGWATLEMSIIHLSEHVKLQEKRIADLETETIELKSRLDEVIT